MTSVPAPTEPPETPGGHTETNSAGSGGSVDAGRQELANLIHDAACECRGSQLGWMIRSRDAELIADALLARGYVREPADDRSVERIAKAISDAKYPELRPQPQRRGPTAPDRRYTRAVLAALRGGA